MRVKRTLEEIKESEYCNFVELTLLLDTPRATLYQQQKKFALLPFTFINDGKSKLYPVKGCSKIYAMFQGKIDEGFTARAAAKQVKESKTYQKIVADYV